MSRASSKLLYVEILKVIAGVQKHLAGQTLVLAGTTITAEDFVTELNGVTSQLTGVENARQAWLAQSKALDDTLSATYNPRIAALHAYVVSRFGASGADLVDFGMKPRQPRKRTGEEIVATAEKAVATRTARHTLGPRAKKAIHGTVAPTPAAPEPAAPTPAAPPPAAPDAKR
jgi:hypothetical protein